MLHSNQSKTVNFRRLPLLLTLIVLTLTSNALFLGDNVALAQENTPNQEPAPAPFVETIRFSQDSVVKQQPFSLTLTNLEPGTIRYTTNGALPDANSGAYQGPINVSRNTVIRAQLFDSDGNPVGGVYTKSYLVVNYDQSIGVVSLVSDWGNFNTLHDAAREHGRAWERPVNVEYFEPGGQVGFNIPAGIRIHGNFSRLFNPKKSFRLYFRESYGPDDLVYPLFEDSPVTTFDKLVLRAGFQDTFTHRGIPDRADRHGTARYINDQVVRDLHAGMGQPIAHGKWVLLYLNGEFWGLYNLTERIDAQFLKSYSPDTNPEALQQWDVIAKESGWDDLGQWYSREEVKDGAYGAWLENQDWAGSADFTIPGNLGAWDWRVDRENLFSYMFLQAYVQATDWPGANWVIYRRFDPSLVENENKWRFMVWDAEDAFGGGANNVKDMNTVERVYSPHDSITRLLEKPFIGSCGFKHEFVNRAREYLGVENKFGKPETEIGQLSKERVKAEILEEAAIVRPFIQMETGRWAPDLPGVAIFEQNIQHSLDFVDVREEVVLHHLDILRYQTFTECK